MSVAYDADASSAVAASYLVYFAGALGGQDIENISTNSTNLAGAAVHPYHHVQGSEAVAETQRVGIATEASRGGFTLSLDHDGQTYTSDTIFFDASAGDVQTIIDAMFAGLGDASVTVSFWSGSQLDLVFGGALAGLDVAGLTVQADTEADEAALAQTVAGYTHIEPAVAAHDVVVDYQAMPLNILAGTGGATLTLNMNGSEGALLRAAGDVTLNVFDFFSVSGGFAFEKSSGHIQLASVDGADPEEVDVDCLTVGGADVDAFAGINGNSDDALGLDLQDVDFALAILTSKADNTRSWTALTADAGSVAFVGIDAITVAAADISVQVNTAGRDNDPVADFAAAQMAVSTGPGREMELNFAGNAGEVIRVKIGRATLAVSDYIYVSGGFYFEKSSGLSVDVVTGLPAVYPAGMDTALLTGLGKVQGLSADHSRIEDLAVDSTIFSATDVDVFVGLGPYFIDSNGNGLFDADESTNSDSLGITLDNIDLGLVFMNSTLAADPDSVIPSFYAMQVIWDDPLDIDWDYFKFDVDGLQVDLNKGGKWRGTNGFANPFVDFFHQLRGRRPFDPYQRRSHRHRLQQVGHRRLHPARASQCR